MEPVLAVDSDPHALKVFKKNFPTSTTKQEDVTHLLDSPFGAPPSQAEKELAELSDHIDVLLGGPPCQGHSDLNNHTRRRDPKNRLYERMARFAELVLPTHIIIENVPAVLHDHGKVVDRTISELESLGYKLDHQLVELSSLGVPQRRRRHVLVASLDHEIDLAAMIAKYERSAPPIGWAISDIQRNGALGPFNTPSAPTEKSLERIEYLFTHNCHDLPDTQRPDCHRLYEHTYRSVYGRLRWNKPAQTITTGFGCIGQGRFVHPKQRRTITPHEAARLQLIPDFFTFKEVESRTVMAQLIGNAVPPKLTYVVALELLR
jgi:DNA (cytosine-5)-methyltransferase 1